MNVARHRHMMPRDTSRLFGRNWHDRLASNDRREFRRMNVSWQGTIFDDGEEHPAIVSDISLGGARVKSAISFTPNKEVTIDIHGIAKLQARQSWQRDGEIGLQFLASPSLVSEKLPSPYADLL